jgi:hypothetical protein
MRKVKEHGPLTPEILRTFEGFEKIADEEAQDIIWTIDALCRAVVEYGKHVTRVEAANIIEDPVERRKKRGRKKQIKKESKDNPKANLCYPIAIKNITPVYF